MIPFSGMKRKSLETYLPLGTAGAGSFETNIA